MFGKALEVMGGVKKLYKQMFGKVLEVIGCKKVIYGKIDGACKHF